MIRSMALHTVNMDNLAACERWYWTKHGAELYRRIRRFVKRWRIDIFPLTVYKKAVTIEAPIYRIWRDTDCLKL